MKATMKTRAPVIRKLPMGENLIISEGGKKAGKKERRGIQYPKFPFTPQLAWNQQTQRANGAAIFVGLLSAGMLPCGSDGKDPSAVKGSRSGSGRSPGKGKATVSVLTWMIQHTEQPGGYSPWGRKGSDMNE